MDDGDRRRPPSRLTAACREGTGVLRIPAFFSRDECARMRILVDEESFPNFPRLDEDIVDELLQAKIDRIGLPLRVVPLTDPGPGTGSDRIFVYLEGGSSSGASDTMAFYGRSSAPYDVVSAKEGLAVVCHVERGKKNHHHFGGRGRYVISRDVVDEWGERGDPMNLPGTR